VGCICTERLKGNQGEKGPIGKDAVLPKPNLIARALESLQGTARLDFESLKNIPGIQVGEMRKRGGGGGGMSDPVHQSFSGDGSTTSFTLSRDVAASGTAIILRYNGQTQDHTTHYTISGAVISMTFTPANGTTISVTFWPG